MKKAVQVCAFSVDGHGDHQVKSAYESASGVAPAGSALQGLSWDEAGKNRLHHTSGSYPDESWHCIRTHSRREADVALQLEAFGFPFANPMLFERQQGRFGWRDVCTPAFPTYVFACFNTRDDHWRKIWSMRGVSGILGPSPDHPACVPDAAMEHIISLDGMRLGVNGAVLKPLRPGEKVRILTGPFANFEGLCTMSANDRVRVMLSLFGRPSEVEMSADHVAAGLA
ncbi:Transcription antitermination protein nusG [Granulibacter bethesdensis]|uniref:Transcription antitermination protein nusG n=1 Tax=Granulibacter bethesdensis TaxID=364410 RepID=A0AAN0RE79_9PROT|nr:transcription termination/antitermination protein NusG [Granulibacter bethesdensis]AHJ63239.1 Transcription antitermination protein nusG [Granulibacter bethesdensis]